MKTPATGTEVAALTDVETPALVAVSRHALAPLERVLFSSNRDEPRRRRPADVVALAAASVVLFLATGVARGAGAGETRVVDGLADALGWLDPLWSALYVSLSGLCLAFAVGAIAGRRRILFRDMFCAAVLTVAVDMVLGRIVQHGWPSLSAALLHIRLTEL